MKSLDDFSLGKYNLNYNIELAILTHDIDLTKYKEKAKSELEKLKPPYNQDYRDQSIPLENLIPPFLPYGVIDSCKYSYYKNEIGYFYIPILMPLTEKDEPIEINFVAPSNINIQNNSLIGKPYVERNFIPLTIPKYIVMNFDDVIPKDTRFIVGIIGGRVKVQNINIIGIYGLDLIIGDDDNGSRVSK